MRGIEKVPFTAICGGYLVAENRKLVAEIEPILIVQVARKYVPID